MMKFFSKSYDVQINAAGQSYKNTFQLDGSVKVINRYTILSNREDLAYYRGSIALLINKEEIAPDGYSVKKVMCWPTVAPDSRQKPTGNCPTGNGQVDFTYTDINDGLTIFQPYTITLSIEGEREE